MSLLLLLLSLLLYDPNSNSPPTQIAVQTAQDAYSHVCPTRSCGVLYVYRNTTVPNVMYVPIQSGIGAIIYNPDFLNQVNVQLGKDAVFGVFAHEIGHHMDLNSGPAAWFDHSWGRELRADAWAGCALARKGFGSQTTRLLLQLIAQTPSHSHPDWSVRIVALEQGYQSCGGQSWPFSVTGSGAVLMGEGSYVPHGQGFPFAPSETDSQDVLLLQADPASPRSLLEALLVAALKAGDSGFSSFKEWQLEGSDGSITLYGTYFRLEKLTCEVHVWTNPSHVPSFVCSGELPRKEAQRMKEESFLYLRRAFPTWKETQATSSLSFGRKMVRRVFRDPSSGKSVHITYYMSDRLDHLRFEFIAPRLSAVSK